jgi:hypothetical protein
VSIGNDQIFVTVKVGIAKALATAATMIAIEKGYFKEAGVKVEAENLDSAANVMALLAQGQLVRGQLVRGRHLGRGARVVASLTAVLGRRATRSRPKLRAMPRAQAATGDRCRRRAGELAGG